MSSRPPDDVDLLLVLDDVLSAALREVRRARAAAVPAAPPRPEGPAGTSQVKLSRDVLVEAGRPLHVNALVDALAQRGVTTTRDTLVSALTKRISPRGPFVRVAPNTFDLVRPKGGE